MEEYKNLIKIYSNNYFKKYETNKKTSKLLSAINYSFNTLNNFDYLISLIPYCILDDFFDRKSLSLSILFTIISIKISFNFPEFLNKFKNDNKTICIHKVFGTTISYLVAFSISLESINILLDSYLNNKIKNDLNQINKLKLHIINKLTKIQDNNNIIKKEFNNIINNNNKKILKKLINNDIHQNLKYLIKIIINICIYLLNDKNTKEKDVNNISENFFIYIDKYSTKLDEKKDNNNIFKGSPLLLKLNKLFNYI